ncbi:GNAT family N-acetyltransferase [Peribacillus sp. NPDC097198]|uniref:GNAT family N-acetyltransferase n=1 Tax=Peribacillus sp. NPDC097198 TaxID=3364397 RepID=UPI0037FDCA09
MYEVISYSDTEKWNQKLNRINNKDIFYNLSYSNLYQSMGDGDPFLFYYEDTGGNRICYPFLKRNINLLPFLKEKEVKYEAFDIITPSYGYGGPIYDVGDIKMIEQFRKEFDEFCLENNIITEFIRFHPLLQNHKHLDASLDISFSRETIFIDLKKSEEEILNGYHKNHYRNVKKAMKNQLEFKVFKNEDAIELADEFYILYKETMDKLNAAEYSYFSIHYLKNLLSGLNNHSMIGAVFFEGQIICAALCLYEGGSLHYHLGCSMRNYLNLGGNTYLLHCISIWGKQKGLHSFHLGGGHVGRDSLFQFKYRFNQDGAIPFYTGKKVHNIIKYREYSTAWEKYYSIKITNDFFPVYRIKPPSNLFI